MFYLFIFFSWALNGAPPTELIPEENLKTDLKNDVGLLSRKNSRNFSLKPDAIGMEKIKEYMSKKGL
jgi:hypothetical protein